MTCDATMSELPLGRCRALPSLAVVLLLGAALGSAAPAAEAVDLFALEKLTVEQATQLPGDRWELSLPKLKTLNRAVALILATKGESLLVLPGITTLTPEVAAALAVKDVGNLTLTGLMELEPDVARELAKSRVSVHLDGVAELSPEAAAALGPCTCPISLRGLQRLSPETADALGRNVGGLTLSAHVVREPDIAAKVAQTGGGCSLADVNDLSTELAKALATGRSELELYGVRLLSPEAAAALATHRWGVSLGIEGLETRDAVAVAAALARKQGRLVLPQLKRISPRTLAALMEKKDVGIPPLESLEIIPEPDGGSADDFVVPDGVPRQQPR